MGIAVWASVSAEFISNISQVLPLHGERLDDLIESRCTESKSVTSTWFIERAVLAKVSA
jgi:hypothetical protein